GEDVDAQDAVSASVGNHLHLSLRLAQAARPAIGKEGEATDPVLVAALLDLLLRPANRRYLRPGVDDAGDRVVIDVCFPARQSFGERDALILGLVRQHRPLNDITDGIYPRNRGLPAFTDDNSPRLLIELHAGVLKPQARRVRPPANRYQYLVALQ